MREFAGKVPVCRISDRMLSGRRPGRLGNRQVTNVEDRFDTTGKAPDDRYGTAPQEAPPLKASEQGRVKVTFEEA